MSRFGKRNLAVLASMTLTLGQSTAGSALNLPGLTKKAKPAIAQPVKTESKDAVKAKPDLKIQAKPDAAPIVSERLKQAAQNLIAARKQVDIARAHLKAAEAEYKVAKIEREAIALRQAAQGMAVLEGSKPAPTERIDAPAPANSFGDLMPVPAKQTMAPAPGWNKQAPEDVSIDDLDLP